MATKTKSQISSETKRFSSVQDMLGSTVGKKSPVTKAVSQRIQSRRLVKKLIVARSKAGLSQTALAQKLGCSQSRISKIENGTDDQLKIADLRSYSSALETGIMFSIGEPKRHAVESIKHHALQIRHHLDQLASLAHKDEKISTGVEDFFGETLFNMLQIIEDSAQKLPASQEPKEDILIYREKETESHPTAICKA